MDTKIQKVLQQINLNLKSISSYIEKLSSEDIKIDENKIHLFDYSIYKWLNKLENQELRKRLEEFNEQSANHLISDNFVEFCRYVYLQIEILLDKFTDHNSPERKQDSNYNKINKLKDFFKVIRGGEQNFKSYEDKEYKMITHIMNIRDIASHADSNGKSLTERVEAKGKSIKIILQNLNNSISQEDIKNIFFEFVIKKNSMIITVKKPEKGLSYAYIQLFDLKYEYLNYNSIHNYIESNLNILGHRLGNKVKVSLNKEQPTNELKIFYEKKDYQQIEQTLNWFIQQIDNYLK
ncbi:hypothetical protein [Nostoc parmelioides]|uniref:RiboL-PSP-HEPN domain-containing protein n=1 Tax=Nostoc parmelioides FACHB-3921 TaxID=2692909 RepID=A0ABR8BBK5_9NOSO|nr:hypothetical protein [Nostoc parmelioides]MBD2250240.1 hypothetical protein [Nostoc parmelioides FACHB-3921]